MKAVISGGGTGGHIYPALSIAEKIMENEKESSILYIGTREGLESRIVPEKGYEFKTVQVRGFQRKLSLENAKRIALFMKGLAQSLAIIKKNKPDVVIGTGGYVCGPVVLAGALLGIPTLIHEQNAFPGITNKFLSRFADRVLISFDDSRRFFTKSKSVVLTGNPVRGEITSANMNSAREKLGIPEGKKMVLSVGGSGGSGTINDAMKGVLPALAAEDFAFIHATGRQHYEGFLKELGDIELKSHQVITDYIDNMADVLAASDLVICSAGAITISEVTCLGKPSIVIPKAYTAENHQEYNARSVKNSGAGEMILEKDLNSGTLLEAVFRILRDEQLHKSMSQKSLGISNPHAADTIYEQIKSLMAEKKGIKNK
ncbi:UDP-N-acetylglucosamine--N-acetylmuramyl-(pentapeptide) pyrophosphoryl-undecaprenol N-acetylglucosamine transferase MurG [Peptoclostridium acidaminophilum DSM 3953]|uniref:UDP-N-acetylglucosamine--N-acetylmuramyl-(pentapeptide) pyrophosphoryl-undecaprenol N-acetylglucosamine transferase n=1 Tax=Peptoclostridium acidaminophilum DSM 3953 TaxID=1286171 RepID=W8U5Z3_PEPAC|nr:undecaprenyldiphospho-muramoylpentapeptide beta-N-acetylglucosaminyltransferase [Peptoclostridium acidaminophilum]AHM56346.1 UDP-N-acetylglucosamine--N-acetylmuramyl-(pentapeptide) pyrophosphoryl-undecaprenol N-acetylglucosamine transferase MurG [Peptoclostridium acidaminophilum DSM 3953]